MRYLSRRLAIIAALWLCHGTAACVFTQEPAAAPVTGRDMGSDQGGGDMAPSDMGGDMTPSDMGGDMTSSDMGADMVVADMGGDMSCEVTCALGEEICGPNRRNIFKCIDDELSACNTTETLKTCEEGTLCTARGGSATCVETGPCADVPAEQRCVRIDATRCSDNGGLEICQGDDNDAQRCPQWVAAQCVDGQVCDPNADACVCENTCAQGQQRCGASGPETCEADNNGCLSWVAQAACSDMQSCQETNNGPTCCEDACAPSESGKGRCTSTSPGRYEVCRLQANGCYSWTSLSCPNASVGDSISSAVACDSMNSGNYIRCSDENPIIGTNPSPECVSVTCSVTSFCDPTSPSTC